MVRVTMLMVMRRTRMLMVRVMRITKVRVKMLMLWMVRVRVMRITGVMVRWVMQKKTWRKMAKKLSFFVSSEQRIQHS